MRSKKVISRIKSAQYRTALERINTLFAEADKAFDKHPERSHRYVKLARRIAMRFRVRLPRELKRRMCKHCISYLVPGRNCVVRTREGKVVYHCKECGGVMRYPYVKEKKKK